MRSSNASEPSGVPSQELTTRSAQRTRSSKRGSSVANDTLRLPAARCSHRALLVAPMRGGDRRRGEPSRGSTQMTSAPAVAKRREQYAPAMEVETSTTRTPLTPPSDHTARPEARRGRRAAEPARGKSPSGVESAQTDGTEARPGRGECRRTRRRGTQPPGSTERSETGARRVPPQGGGGAWAPGIDRSAARPGRGECRRRAAAAHRPPGLTEAQRDRGAASAAAVRRRGTQPPGLTEHSETGAQRVPPQAAAGHPAPGIDRAQRDRGAAPEELRPVGHGWRAELAGQDALGVVDELDQQRPRVARVDDVLARSPRRCGTATPRPGGAPRSRPAWRRGRRPPRSRGGRRPTRRRRCASSPSSADGHA